MTIHQRIARLLGHNVYVSRYIEAGALAPALDRIGKKRHYRWSPDDLHDAQVLAALRDLVGADPQWTESAADALTLWRLMGRPDGYVGLKDGCACWWSQPEDVLRSVRAGMTAVAVPTGARP